MEASVRPRPRRARAVTRRAPERTEAPLRGLILNEATGYPVADLTVTATLVRGADGAAPGAALGDATTDQHGRFVIAWTDDPLIPRVVERLTRGEGAVTLKVRSGRRILHETPPIVGLGGRSLTLEVALDDAALSDAVWRQLANRLEDARIVQLHAVARQLVHTSAANSIFGDWPLARRHAVAAELERRLLDPDAVLSARAPVPGLRKLQRQGALEAYEAALGDALDDAEVRSAFDRVEATVAEFASLLDVDWVVGTAEIKSGKVGQGVTKFGTELDPSVHESAAEKEVPFAVSSSTPTDRSRYRDYLRTIFTGPKGQKKFNDYLLELRTRFHQDFTTLDVEERPLNEILIGVVTKILTAPEGEYGFGLTAADVPARGELSAREHLDVLIDLTGVSADELGLRYRIDLARADHFLSSAVWENVRTLQRFYRDGFQSVPDPKPIIPAHLRGQAPFYLEWEEWLRMQGPFHAENALPMAATFSSGIHAEDRDEAINVSDEPWLEWVFDAEDALAEGMRYAALHEHALAAERYAEVDRLAYAVLSKAFGAPHQVFAGLAPRIQQFADLPLDAPEDLDAFVDFCSVSWMYVPNSEIEQWDAFGPWFEVYRDDILFSTLHLYVSVLPTLRGDLEMARGHYAAAEAEYAAATGFAVGRAQLGDGPGWLYGLDPEIAHSTAPSGIFREGPLPYTADVKAKNGSGGATLAERFREHRHPAERRFLELRHAAAMLEWADALYRTDAPDSLNRARELYKAVTWLHGERFKVTRISPKWKIPQWSVGRQIKNPALVSQAARATAGRVQIDEGLNYYGCDDGLVPTLRYRPLKDAADRFAATAKAAQHDFLGSMGKIEDTLLADMASANMLTKARLQAEIASEQAENAKVAIAAAQHQIKEIEKAIEEKKKEIEEEEAFFNQAVGFIGGMVDWAVDTATDPSVAAGLGLSSSAGGSGAAAGGSGAAAGVAAGGAVLGAYAAFIAAAYSSLSSLNDENVSRRKQLTKLRTEVLPAAKQQLELRERDLKIINLHEAVADADAQLALELMRFQQMRFLSAEFWADLAAVFKRVMRRFLVLGARYGWLAERALAHEQDRAIDIIRFDYAPADLQGVTGADLLQLDLGELEATRLDGVRQALPIERTYSLARDFPIAFAQLRATGRCTFLTQTSPLALAHPGTYGHRVRALTVSPVGAGAPAVGMVRADGASSVTRADGAEHLLLRPTEAAPISDFRLRDDMTVHGLGETETLMPFEGIGAEAFWTIELPRHANEFSLDGLADVMLTFDLRAHYSEALREKHAVQGGASAHHMVLLSGKHLDPEAFEALSGEATGVVELSWDGAAAPLPTGPTREVRNLVLMAPGAAGELSASFRSSSPTPPADVEIVNGVAMSTAAPLTGPSVGPSPLNAWVGEDLAQTFTLAIDKDANVGAGLAGLVDVVLGVEYEVTPAQP